MATKSASQPAPTTEPSEGGARPVRLDGALPGGYSFNEPLTVLVWNEGTDVVADAPDLDVHAFGSDPETALDNLRARIVDQLARLEELGDQLAPRMVRSRDRLRSLLVAPHR